MSSNLIEMNAHMVRTELGNGFMWIGLLTAIVLVIGCFADCLMNDSWKRIRFYILPIAIFIAMFIYGMLIPRVKEIRYCANGPVSIEQVNNLVDIVKVDGKEIVVRER